MTLYLDIFDHKFEQAQQRLVELAQKTDQAAVPKDILAQAIDELTNALEEVQVLSEELSEQHDRLQTAQVVLSTERQQYFDLFDLAPEGYIVTNAQGIIQQINQTAADLLNRRQPFLIGRPLGALVAQADNHEFYTLLNRLQAGEAFQNFELRLQSYPNQLLYVSFTIAPIWDHHAQLVGLRWLFRDQTRQRQSAIALEESEAQYRAIVEDQTELICRSLADGRLIFVNRAFCQYFNRSSESVVGQSFFDLIVEADQEMVMRQLASLDRDNPVITLEHRVSLDGQIRWQSWIHRALFDRDGDFFQFQSAGRDITVRKQTEEALQDREAQLRLVTDSLPVLLAYVNAQQQLVYVNRAHERWLGMHDTDIVERYLWEGLGPMAYQQVRMPVEEALSGDYVTFEQEITLPNHAPFWINATLVPDRTVDNRVNGFFALVNDISDRKSLEHQKDQLISVVSHELRTPLTSIHGALKLLTHEALDPLSAEGQNLLAVADRSAQRMVGLVDDLLDLQQIELGKMSLSQGSCPAADLIQQAMDTLKTIAEERDITLRTFPCFLSVWADRDRIIQVLTNLISNAIKFSSAGNTVIVTAGKAVDPFFPPMSPHVRFQVRDQGRGMPEDSLDHIFEPFYQIETPDIHCHDGTGLGLAICRSIVQQHGGSIKAESELGRGTVVSFTLPYNDS